MLCGGERDRSGMPAIGRTGGGGRYEAQRASRGPDHTQIDSIVVSSNK
jgi:hypothetical protein